MYSRAFSTLLIAAIVGCPLFCRSGLCHAGTSATECGAHRCCCSHSEPVSNDQHPCPGDPSSPRDEKNCQGICGGAVFENADLRALTLDASRSLPVAVVERPLLQHVQVAGFHPLDAAPWPGHGMNPGRALCHLYSVLLC